MNFFRDRKIWYSIYKQYMKNQKIGLCSSPKFEQMYAYSKFFNYTNMWANRFLIQIKKSNSHRIGITSFEVSNNIHKLFDKPLEKRSKFNHINDCKRVRIEFLKFMCNRNGRKV